MQHFTLLDRQLSGCGFAPAVAGARPIDHDGRTGALPLDDDGLPRGRNTVCPGYTCGLPEVIEASRARQWREKGGLRDFTRGEQPSDALMLAVDIIDAESAKATSWAMKNPPPKGS
jgi:hypothetical protein